MARKACWVACGADGQQAEVAGANIRTTLLLRWAARGTARLVKTRPPRHQARGGNAFLSDQRVRCHPGRHKQTPLEDGERIWPAQGCRRLSSRRTKSECATTRKT